MKSTNFQTQMAHLPKMIFLELTNFLVPLGPFHYEKSQKILTVDPDLWWHASFRPKWSIPHNENFFRKTINISSIYPLVPFIEQNFKKVLRVDPELRGYTIFGTKMTDLPKMQLFFTKTINIISMYFLTLFIVQNFKKILGVDP